MGTPRRNEPPHLADRQPTRSAQGNVVVQTQPKPRKRGRTERTPAPPAQPSDRERERRAAAELAGSVVVAYGEPWGWSHCSLPEERADRGARQNQRAREACGLRATSELVNCCPLESSPKLSTGSTSRTATSSGTSRACQGTSAYKGYTQTGRWTGTLVLALSSSVAFQVRSMPSRAATFCYARHADAWRSQTTSQTHS